MSRQKRGTDGGQKGRERVWPRVAGLVLAAVLTVAIVVVALKYDEIRDYLAGRGYEPTAEMVKIRDELGLTGRARLVFDASWPELNERGDFNRNCRSGEETDVAILGCYTGGKIYVYDVVNEELVGVRELATAHELLHAMWARMGEKEREDLSEKLQGVLAGNDWLAEELAIYNGDERAEELYVRAGTEVRDLPEELSAHYAKMFEERGKVVDYYEGYIAVFRGIEERMAEIYAAVEVARAELDEAVANYEWRVTQWSADVVSFNACAAVEGCFASEAEFAGRRAGLVAEQEELLGTYERIERMVDRVNDLVDEYNSNVVHGQMLSDAVNSLAVPDGI